MSYLTVDDGVNLYYDDTGDGEALIFCHGLNSSHTINESFYREFRTTLELYSMIKEVMGIQINRQST